MGRVIINDILTEKIIGCCFDVHRKIGPGFVEKIYYNSLCKALDDVGLKYSGEKLFKVVYKMKHVGNFKADLFVEDKVIVEIKAVSGVMPRIFISQILSYLKASGVKVGLLINFGNDSCYIKRLVV
ncbi:MAG: hypothetical protein A2231_07320 [Candidatus Firestonebacteria bacterium RIFOXYA2_FULL_40_8]|nr:MAG: hypothetical protein A2231_07320 [Candidatus Firestonebacteria bacterium RIFOXYA2_FULL_40_8]